VLCCTLRHQPAALQLTILKAAAAALNPASMFTTLTPGAQLFIMVSMAATPPKEAP